MYDTTLHPKPAWRTVFRAQLPFMGRQFTPKDLAIGFGLVALMTGIILWIMQDDPSARDWHEWQGLIALGLMAAFEYPSRRQYRWSMPVSRPYLALARAAAEWLRILFMFSIALLLPLLIAASLTGFLGDPAWFLSFVRVLAGASILFLLVYPITLHTDQAFWWLLAPFFAYVLAQALLETVVLAPVGRVIDGAINSLLFAVLGKSWASVTPFPGSWSSAAILWIGIGVAATLVSALLLREGGRGATD